MVTPALIVPVGLLLLGGAALTALFTLALVGKSVDIDVANPAMGTVRLRY